MLLWSLNKLICCHFSFLAFLQIGWKPRFRGNTLIFSSSIDLHVIVKTNLDSSGLHRCFIYAYSFLFSATQFLKTSQEFALTGTFGWLKVCMTYLQKLWELKYDGETVADSPMGNPGSAPGYASYWDCFFGWKIVVE